MKRTLITVLSCALWLSTSTPAMTQEEPTTEAGKTQVTAEETQFMKDAAQSGMAEVKMGELASSNGESRQVKAFAQKLVTDHGKVDVGFGVVAVGPSFKYTGCLLARKVRGIA